MNTGDIKVSEATTSAAETLALYRAEARAEEIRQRTAQAEVYASSPDEGAQHHARYLRALPPPAPVDLPAIYAEALALGMRTLLAQVTSAPAHLGLHLGYSPR